MSINRGDDDNNDSDWANMVGSDSVGITCPMAVLGAFRSVRTTPNAYGQMFNVLTAYDWTPEVGRAVDLGVFTEDTPDVDGWQTIVVRTPWGTKVFNIKLPQTGDDMALWLFVLSIIAAIAVMMVICARWKDDDEDEIADDAHEASCE